MTSTSTSSLRLLRYSLVFVWLATAVVSIWELNSQSIRLLFQAGLTDLHLDRATIIGGAFLDVVLGLALAFRPGRMVYIAALIAMMLMTLAATFLLSSLWLHPLGPLMKNVPIAACLWHLLQSEERK